MSYRIPSTDAVREAIRRVLTRTRGVSTLKELTTHVLADLHEEDPRYRLGPERVRRVASRMNAVRTTIQARHGGRGPPATRCPVCGGTLRTARNRTLHGDEVALERRCTTCPYWTGRDRRIPQRYTFHLKEWRFARPGRGRKGPDMSTPDTKPF